MNQSTLQKHVAEVKRVKRVRASNDCFWFYFWLDDEVAPFFFVKLIAYNEATLRLKWALLYYESNMTKSIITSCLNNVLS